MAPERTSYRHTLRLFLLLGTVLVMAVVVRTLLVPESYGEHGHFRYDAVAEAREHEQRHVGAGVCAECHDDIVDLHDKDAHFRVACETCHGPGAAHAAAEGDGPITRPEGGAPCLVCHLSMPSRPGDFPQIVPEDHYRFVGVRDADTPCTACHDPHEPLYMDRDIRTARLHPLMHRCRDCHSGRTDETLARPENHPPIFSCDYCHPEIAAGFTARPHREVRCSACHLFFRESESAGRIIRDADPRFCLLCHRDTDFRSDDAPPGIDWPDHRDDMAETAADLDKRCIDCHQDRIHPLLTHADAEE